LYQQINN